MWKQLKAKGMSMLISEWNKTWLEIKQREKDIDAEVNDDE